MRKQSYFMMAALPVVTGVLGVIIAMILEKMNDAGVMIDEFISGTITLVDLQVFVIITCLIVGIIITVHKS